MRRRTSILDAPTTPRKWGVDDYGMTTRNGEFTFVHVHDAPYEAAMSQPEACLGMIKRWTEGSLQSTSYI